MGRVVKGSIGTVLGHASDRGRCKGNGVFLLQKVYPRLPSLPTAGAWHTPHVGFAGVIPLRHYLTSYTTGDCKGLLHPTAHRGDFPIALCTCAA